MKSVKTLVTIASIVGSTIASQAQSPTAPLVEMKKAKKTINVAFLIYDQVEAMDLNGPIDVFTKANVMDPTYKLYTVSASSKHLTPSEGGTVMMQSTYSFENAPQADILIVPGAAPQVISNTVNNQPELFKWINKQNEKTKITMSVCTGALLLSNAGVLDGKKATTHYLELDELRKNTKIEIVEKVRFVEDGKVITAAGITSGLDGSLHLIERINGKELADQIGKIMVYNRNGDMSFME
ncbi:DJ-1/PfpI family protein [Pedobacter caeni]|uniref:DJ-1/PfpI family protein n=1 Tax=Pedobacter caeni TaxID=288992 RepID=A0A1M5AKX5_9SPHI|nr:DJ-1/PfpI family protein [Pedobacter caeni]SHF30899.1 DJ-1/PfpI family protein [Pedobacter caeni]